MNTTPAILTLLLLSLCNTALAANELTAIGPNDGVDDDNFGATVDVDGDWLVAGSTFADVDGIETQGAAYVFRRNAQGGYDQVTKLVASDGVEFDQLGTCVGISGDTIVVGAKGAPVDTNSSQGAAYVFRQNPSDVTDWPQILRLEAETSVGNIAEYGTACAIDGNTLVVGAQKAGSGGQAFVYDRDAGGTDNWGEVRVLQDDISDSNASFGFSVALDGDTLAVGATSLDVVAFTFNNEGGVYLFERDEGGADNWGQTDKLFASNAQSNASFGSAVALAGDRLVVGSRFYNGPANSSEGRAYIFERAGAAWLEEKVLVAANAGLFHYYGTSVALAGSSVFVGGTGVNNDRGRVYRYEQDEGGAANWGESDQLLPSVPVNDDLLGASLSITNGVLAAGTPGPGTSGPGRVLAFDAPLSMAADSDSDGVLDDTDNCTLIENPDQRDTNGDGFGNLCDADLDDNGTIDFADLAIMKARFFSTDADADLDGDGTVAFPDLAIMKAGFFGAPGPAG